MKAIAEAKVLRSDDCWRLLVACLRYDDGTGRIFNALCDGGAIETLFRLKGKHQLLAQLTRLSTQDPLALKALQHLPALPHFAIEASEGEMLSQYLQYLLITLDKAIHNPPSNSSLHIFVHTPSHIPSHTPSHTPFREITVINYAMISLSLYSPTHPPLPYLHSHTYIQQSLLEYTH